MLKTALKTVYVPIVEEESALLEIQTGCSYRQCSFCDFARDHFEIFPLELILRRIDALAEQPEVAGKSSLFLLGQNALCQPTEKLIQIIAYAKEKLPGIQEVNLYARADDINRKGREGLAKLREAGLSHLHIGLESGSDQVLARMNKGVNVDKLLQAFTALESCGLYYHVTYILGLGGQALWREHVQQTANLLNAIHPLSIWALNLKLWPETPLYQDAKLGCFQPLKPEQMLLEEQLILERLEGPECLYMDTTVLGEYSLVGMLPENKEQFLQQIAVWLQPYDLREFLAK